MVYSCWTAQWEVNTYTYLVRYVYLMVRHADAKKKIISYVDRHLVFSASLACIYLYKYEDILDIICSCLKRTFVVWLLVPYIPFQSLCTANDSYYLYISFFSMSWEDSSTALQKPGSFSWPSLFKPPLGPITVSASVPSELLSAGMVPRWVSFFFSSYSTPSPLCLGSKGC